MPSRNLWGMLMVTRGFIVICNPSKKRYRLSNASAGSITKSVQLDNVGKQRSLEVRIQDKDAGAQGSVARLRTSPPRNCSSARCSDRSEVVLMESGSHGGWVTYFIIGSFFFLFHFWVKAFIEISIKLFIKLMLCNYYPFIKLFFLSLMSTVCTSYKFYISTAPALASLP